MKIDIVIPARYGSTRLPGKMLLRSTGKYLVQHVYERACESKLARSVIVATDDSRIQAAVRGFGGHCVMTRRDHASGTDRIAEVARSLDSDIVVNVQGDEPEIDPGVIDTLAQLLVDDRDAPMATLAVPFASLDAWRNPNCVKVVCDGDGRALYFSRSPVPYVRDGEPDLLARPPQFLHHLGLYAYRREFLFKLAAMPVAPLESLERLEQLRALAAGVTLRVGVVPHSGRGVDTFADYERFRRAVA